MLVWQWTVRIDSLGQIFMGLQNSLWVSFWKGKFQRKKHLVKHFQFSKTPSRFVWANLWLEGKTWDKKRRAIVLVSRGTATILTLRKYSSSGNLRNSHQHFLLLLWKMLITNPYHDHHLLHLSFVGHLSCDKISWDNGCHVLTGAPPPLFPSPSSPSLSETRTSSPKTSQVNGCHVLKPASPPPLLQHHQLPRHPPKAHVDQNFTFWN